MLAKADLLAVRFSAERPGSGDFRYWDKSVRWSQMPTPWTGAVVRVGFCRNADMPERMLSAQSDRAC